MKIKHLRFCLFVFMISVSSNVNGQGHYNGGSFNTNDYFIPSATGWVFSLYYSFSEMSYYNDSGVKTDVIEITEDPPFSVELGQKVSTMLCYITLN